MNRKQLLILLVIGLVAGGLGLYLHKSGEASYKTSDQVPGKKLLGDFVINDVAQVAIKQGTNELNLVKEDDLWKVRERFNYPANFSEISEFVRKAANLKTVQSPQVGPSQFARLELNKPGQGTNSGTLVEFKDKSGKTIKSLLLGKKYLRESPESSPMGGGGYPVGRYVLALDGAQKVALVSDALANVEPKPDNWLNKDFFKIEKLRAISIAAVIDTNNWKLTRETETGDWTLADKKEGEELDKGKSSSVSYALSSPSFNDVVSPASKPEETGMDKPVVASLETFDNLVYTVRIGKKTGEDNYFMTMAVAGDLPKERTPGKDEKPEDKEKLEKEFKEKVEKLKEKLNKEKAFEKWTYLVSKWTVDPLLKERKDLFADKKAEPKKDEPAEKKAEPDSPDKDDFKEDQK
jgi:Domain of unknown function (DUF4340)